jgi:hypothetical protein
VGCRAGDGTAPANFGAGEVESSVVVGHSWWEDRDESGLNSVSYIDGSREEFPERRTYDDSN